MADAESEADSQHPALPSEVASLGASLSGGTELFLPQLAPAGMSVGGAVDVSRQERSPPDTAGEGAGKGSVLKVEMIA